MIKKLPAKVKQRAKKTSFKPKGSEKRVLNKTIDPLYISLGFLVLMLVGLGLFYKDNLLKVINQGNLNLTKVVTSDNSLLTETAERVPEENYFISYPYNKLRYYCQHDGLWYSYCTLGGYGCSPTSVAMLMATFGKRNSYGVLWNPKTVASYFLSRGWRGCDGGGLHFQTWQVFSPSDYPYTTWASGQGVSAARMDLRTYGYFSYPSGVYKRGVLDIESAYNFFKVADSSGNRKYYIIAGSSVFPCVSGTRCNHAFVIDNVDLANRTYHVQDPYNCTWANNQTSQIAIASRQEFKANAFPLNYAYPIRKDW